MEKGMLRATGTVLVATLVGCASSGGPEESSGPPPNLLGDYQLTVEVRAGALSQDVHGILEFREGGWVVWRPLQGNRQRVGPCRYRERGRALQIDCGIDARIEETSDGLLATVEANLRETYVVEQCVRWVVRDGRRVCDQTREFERSRFVEGHGQGLLERLPGS